MAEWTASFISRLPDSSFACIDPGGEKDDEGKTTPRSKRHYPHHGADGKLDLIHLRNALSRVNQDDTTSCGRDHLEAHARAEGLGGRARRHLREERALSVELEVREDEGQPPRIVGYPIRYDVWSEDLGGFRERIRPGAATKTIAEADIRVLFNHDPNIVLGRNRSGTATFVEDRKGVRVEVTPPETQTVQDLVLAPMRRGDVNQMSFAFRAIRDEWHEPKKPGQLAERDLFEFRMYDGSVVTFPGYTQTEAAVRGLLEGVGIDWAALSACITRAERGLHLTDADTDLLTGSIDVLRSYIPQEPEPSATTPVPQAGPPLAHLRRVLDLRERELALT